MSRKPKNVHGVFAKNDSCWLPLIGLLLSEGTLVNLKIPSIYAYEYVIVRNKDGTSFVSDDQ